MSLPDVDQCYMIILGILYRTERDGVDRSSQAAAGKIDAISGLAQSVNDIAPRSQWLTGERLAMECVFSSFKLARACIVRMLRDDVTGEEEDCSLYFVKPQDWTPEESDAVNELNVRFSKAIKQLAAKGFVNENPNIGLDGEAMQLKDDGTAFACKATYSGLLHAREKIRGNPLYEKGPTSIYDVMPKDMAAQSQSDWAKGKL